LKVPVAVELTVIIPVAGSIVIPAGSLSSEYVSVVPVDEVAETGIVEITVEVPLCAGIGVMTGAPAGAGLTVTLTGAETVVVPSLA
jgi:hypothetical protein